MAVLAGVRATMERTICRPQAPRVVWRAGNRVHVRVPGVAHGDGAALARAVEAALARHDAVKWAAVNAPLGVVVVECDGDVREADLVGIVEQMEREFPDPAPRPGSQPSPVNRVPGEVFPLAAAAAGLALASMGRALRVARLPAEIGSLVQFVDTQPRLRRVVEQAVGPDGADYLLATASSLAQSAAQGLGGLAVDVSQRVLQLAEAALESDSWTRSEPGLCGSRNRAAAPPVTPERPRPLPPGPIETYSEQAGLGSALAFGSVLAASRSPRRAAGVAVAGIPKAARAGREGFAAALGCVLARRGVVVIDHRALRLLDRIDTVVIDTESLTTDALVVRDVVPVSGADRAHVTAMTHSLFDAERTGELVTDGTFTIGPLEALPLRGRTGSRPAAGLVGRGAERVLGLARASSLQAVIGIAAERTPGADLLLAAAKRSGVRVVLAAPANAPRGDEAVPIVPGGRRLVATVRGMQGQGSVVLLVSSHRRALAAADIGVGLTSGGGRPPWGAHLLAGQDLAAAALVVDATRVAAAVSRRAVHLAQAGSALGGTFAFRSSERAAARRSLLAVNAATAASLAVSAWSVFELARLPARQLASAPPWHAMPAEIVVARLHSRAEGLTSSEARRRWRPDDRDVRAPSIPRALLEELANPLTPILGGGALLSVSIGAVADAVIVSGVVGLSALMGSVQRAWTERSMAHLLTASAITARVLRDGGERTLPAAMLVSGDVIVLGPNDVVPADCRLLNAVALQVDESSLTGESAPVEKTTTPVWAATIADRGSMLYEGTTVATGHATAVVVTTGSSTEVGKSLAAVSAAAPPTGVEARLSQITRTTLPLALGSAGAVVAFGLLRGHPARDTVGAAVGLAVASVPEGLPFLVTAAQLASARRLAGHGALVRNPRTIEALGRVDVLCFDKTGTLTEGLLAVAAVSDGTATRRPGDALLTSHRETLAAALRATPQTDGRRDIEHVTDQAVTAGAAGQHIGRDTGNSGWRRIDSVPFEPSRAYHATLASTVDGRLLSVKGAPEVILPRCAKWRGRDLSPKDRRRLDHQLDQLAKGGYRVLAVAENQVGADFALSGAMADLTFIGFVAFGDRIRATAGISVRELRDAGVHIVMITGDHPATATAVARELEVLNGGEVITGADIDRLDDAALPGRLADATVIARCTPEHKVRVVRAFQASGRVVAMTGDGANDAAAIRLADVGIALGRRGTPAARAAGDLVVTDDKLETIISAVIEGRAMWRSVRQAIGILVGGNIGEIGYTLLGTLLSGTSPLSARQLLLVNLLTDLVPAMTVALRTPAPETAESLLAEGPDTSLGSALTEEIAVRAGATGAAASVAWLAARLTGSSARARTVGLATVIGAELGQTLLVGGRSPAVALAALASIGVLVVVVQTPGLSQFFGCTPIGPVGWSIAAVSAAAATAGSVAMPRLGRSLAPAVGPVAEAIGGEHARSVQEGIRSRVSRLTEAAAHAASTGARS